MKALALILGLAALTIPVLITIMIYAWDAYLWIFVLPGIPLSLILLIGSWVLGCVAGRETGEPVSCALPSLLTVLTTAAYWAAIAKLATMPCPP